MSCSQHGQGALHSSCHSAAMKPFIAWCEPHRPGVRIPRIDLSGEQEEAADKAGGADLKYLLAKQEVKIENQRLFFHHGVTTVEKLASLAKDIEDRGKMQREEVQIQACMWHVLFSEACTP